MQDYIAFVRVGAGGRRIWRSLRGQVHLGSEAFAEKMKRQLPKGEGLREVPRAYHRAAARPLSDYVSRNTRHKAMAQAWLAGDYTMREIGGAFGVHYTTVRRAVRAREQAEWKS